MIREIYFGPPGTGKTTTLLKRLEGHLRDGIPPDRIAFLTFTRRARREAIEKVEQVLDIKSKELPHFRTIHSMAYKALELKEGDVLGRAQLTEFGTAMGLTFGNLAATELAAEGVNSADDGDVMLALDNIARLRGQTLQECWRQARSLLEFAKVEHFHDSYEKYKRDTGLLDFTDVLHEFVRAQIALPVDVAFIDEAQDLSGLQWLAALQAIASAPTQYVAGDDDQAIYRWAGADVQTFMDLPGDRVVLSQSYRLPRIVHKLAMKLAARIKVRVPKEFSPRDAEGKIIGHSTMESIKVEPNAQWLWLVRNRYLLTGVQNYLQEKGLVFSQHGYSSIREKEMEAIYNWERLRTGKQVTTGQARDLYKMLATKSQVAHGHKLLPGALEDSLLTEAELRDQHGLLAKGTWFEVLHLIPAKRRAYYRKLLRAHGTLKLAPQIQLETIHGSKGAQADNVALFLEQSKRVWEEALREPDDEHRVWYVGATRAREQLHVVFPGSRWGYQLPRVVDDPDRL